MKNYSFADKPRMYCRTAHQDYLELAVRGKTKAPTEFGAKYEVFCEFFGFFIILEIPVLEI